MAKQLNVNLALTADASKAKAELASLQKTLQDLATSASLSTKGLGLTEELNQAAIAASNLSIKLSQSIDSFGNLDLGKFNQNLKASGKTLEDYATELKALGPQGAQAFSQLSKSITLAAVPLKKSNTLLQEFATTLKNTARWQISSSILHGFMGAVSSAYGYAQDLNESLTNIRIVTGYNAERMSEFADEANKAARALSTTTTEYTNASLIFYQQGLSDEDVKTRTDITIKMANAAGVSAEKASDQLTAVWNNFYDGSKSLEYYADVMTALGAATASSTDEISEGLNKFAAVAETVGLSYEYAAAALATVTAETRQSADVVGTAFKTLFARLQDLELGQTLDDGTTLGKYSAALNSVGINIKDVSGNLKDMDVILDELGDKWTSLSKDTQVALAQTVAGTRQYTQLVALMDNWNVFETNLGTAQNSEGALQEQANIYAEGWEAARDRVTAAAEDIYGDLLKDDVFISLLNGFAGLLDTLDLFIDAMGGLSGMLPLLTSWLLKAFGPDLAENIDRGFYNLKLGSEIGRKELADLRQEAIEAQRVFFDDGTKSGSAQIDIFDQRATLQKQLIDKTIELEGANKRLTAEEELQAQKLLDINNALGEQYLNIIKNIEAEEAKVGSLTIRAGAEVGRANKANEATTPDGQETTNTYTTFKSDIKEVEQLSKKFQTTTVFVTKFKKVVKEAISTKDISKQQQALEKLRKQFKLLGDSAENAGADIDDEIISVLKKLGSINTVEALEAEFNGLEQLAEDAGGEMEGQFDKIIDSANAAGVDMQKFSPIIDQIKASFMSTGTLTADQIQLFANLGIQVDAAGNIIEGFSGSAATMGDAIAAGASAASTLAMAFNQASQFGSKLFDEETPLIEKFTSGIMLAVTTIQTFNAIRTAQQTITEAITALQQKENAATLGAIIAEKARTVATNAANMAKSLGAVLTGKMTIAEWLNTAAVNANTAAWYSNPITAVIAVALLAVVAVIGAVSSAIEANSQELQENAQKWHEQAQAEKEANAEHRASIATMKDLMEQYKTDKSVKSDLDEVTRALAEAYGLEGAALAKLSGEYSDYETVYENALEAQRKELKERLKTEEQAKATAQNAMLDTAREGNGRKSGSSYLMDFEGWGTDAEADAANSIAKYVNKDFINNVDTGGLISGVHFELDYNDPSQMVELYDQLMEAKAEMDKEMSPSRQADSGIYQETEEWLERMEEDVERYRTHVAEIEKINAALGTKMTIQESEVDSQEDFNTWISEVRTQLSKTYDSAEEVDTIIKDMINNSLNPDLSGYYDIYNAINEIKNAGTSVSRDTLTELYSKAADGSGEFDMAALSMINWGAVTERTYYDACVAAQKYLDQQQAIIESTETLTNISAMQELVTETGVKDHTKAKETLDWGNQEKGIIEYNQFLAMSYEQQVEYLNNLFIIYNQKLHDTTVAAFRDNAIEIEKQVQLKQKALKNYQQAMDIGDQDGIRKYKAQIESATSDIERLTEANEANAQSLYEMSIASVTNTKSLEELDNAMRSLLEAQSDVQGIFSIDYYDVYANQLMEIANQYSNCADEVARYAQARLGLEKTSEEIALEKEISNFEAEQQAKQGGMNRYGFRDTDIRAVTTDDMSIDDERAALKDLQDERAKANQARIKEAENALRAAVMIGELAEQYDLEAEAVDNYADRLKDLHKESKLSSQDAARLAVANMRLDRGVKNLNENLEDYTKQLKKTAKGSAEWSDIMDDIKTDLADILNIADGNMISDEFAESLLEGGVNAEILAAALKGDSDAILTLRQLAAENIIFNIDTSQLNENLGGMDTIQTKWQELKAMVEDNKIEPGVETENFIKAFNEMAQAGNFTKEQIEAAMSGLNVGAELKTTYNASTHEIPYQHTWSYVDGYKTVDYYNASTGELEPRNVPTIATKTEDAGTYVATEYVPSYEIVGTTDGGGGVTTGVNVLPAPTVSTSSVEANSGGSKSEPKKANPTKKTDVVDRYKEVNDKLDDAADKMEDASKAADKLWGAARLKQMAKVREAMTEEIDLLREKRKEAEEYLAQDQSDLQKALDDSGLAAGKDFTFDANGNISNYESIMTSLYNQLSAAEKAAGDTWDDEEQEKIDDIKERIEKVAEAIDLYDTTREELQEIDNAIDDKITEIQEAKFEELSLELELKLTINETSMKMIEYEIQKLGEDFYAMSEVLGLMGADGGATQLSTYAEALAAYQDNYDKILHSYKTINPDTGEREINQEQFVTKLQELQDGLYENLGAILELDDAVLHYYGDTLAAAGDELAKYTDQMDHHVSVLDHYANLLELIGASKDWERVKKVQEAQVEVAANAAEVSKANYEMLARQVEEIKTKLQDTGLSDRQREILQQQLDDAIVAAQEAEDKMLSDAAAWAEQLKSMLETELAELADILDEALSGEFGSLDNMMTAMERANSLQEEFLTTTNKVYETNKIMRTAQQEIDKTSNTVAKRRLKQFIDETESLQEKTKLSKFELEIQQAKYDLLLAEIALEEAQSAKSTVRLQRDSEGNLGYVYTADQNAVNDAQQQLEDAQNNLYNIGLEGANKYAESYAQTIQEMNDAIAELTEAWQNGEISSREEYEEKMLALKEYYGQKLEDYSDLHTIALSADSRIAADAWTKDFVDMTTQTDLWMQKVDEHTQGAIEAFGRYGDGIAQVEEHVGLDLDTLAEKTAAITQANEDLKDSIVDPENGVIKKLEDELTAVGNLALKYGELRDAIQDAIDKANELAETVGQTIMNESDDDESNDLKPENSPTETPAPETVAPPPEEKVKPYQTGYLTWTGDGADRIWSDSSGNRYQYGSAEQKAIQAAFNTAKRKNGGYRGDYWMGWNKLNADVLHEKYGLATGGYTGDWEGSYGKLAFLHQKELVLNAGDTENFLASMELLNRIIQAIDLNSANAQLGGLLSSPGYSGGDKEVLEQYVTIEAKFEGATEASEIELAFENLINKASQYANRK